MSHIPVCGCGKDGVRSEKFDAYYCPTCDKWLENRCHDLTCEFCGKRPEKPSEAGLSLVK